MLLSQKSVWDIAALPATKSWQASHDSEKAHEMGCLRSTVLLMNISWSGWRSAIGFVSYEGTCPHVPLILISFLASLIQFYDVFLSCQELWQTLPQAPFSEARKNSGDRHCLRSPIYQLTTLRFSFWKADSPPEECWFWWLLSHNPGLRIDKTIVFNSDRLCESTISFFRIKL